MFSIKYLVDIMWKTTAHIICIFAKFGEYAKCAPDGSPSDFSPLAQTHSVRVHYFCHEPTIIYGVDTCGRLKNLQKTYFRYHDQLICILLKYIYKPWGPLPVETRGTGPPKFSFGGANNGFGPPKFQKFIIIVIQ